MNIKIITNSEEETKLFAEQFAKQLKGGEVICFSADVGAGKTMFTQGLCKGLGVENDYVNSPSYIIMNEYTTKNNLKIYHYDLYRICSLDELTEIGYYDHTNTENKNQIAIIEWSEMLDDEKPDERIEIEIKITGASEREIIINSMNNEQWKSKDIATPLTPL